MANLTLHIGITQAATVDLVAHAMKLVSNATSLIATLKERGHLPPCFALLGLAETQDAIGQVELETQDAVDVLALRAQVTEVTATKNSAYAERNQIVAALARCFPSGIRPTSIEGWLPEWNNCVFIDLPTGQASWHYHDDQAHLFSDLPAYETAYDGHSTAEKYERLRALLKRDAAAYRIPDLNDDLIAILGRPFYQCARPAAQMRHAGAQIPYRTEDDQAAVIHFLLRQHAQHGKAWAEKANETLLAMGRIAATTKQGV